MSRLAPVLVLALLALPSAAAASPPAFYVADEDNDRIYQFELDGSLNLAPMTTPFVASSDAPERLAATPDKGSGATLYATGQLDGVISQYAISPTDGSLTAIGGAQDIGTSATGIAVDPEGAFAYVLNPDLETVRRYPITGTGALGAGTDVITAAPAQLWSLAMSRDGRSLYVGASGGQVQQYDVDPGTGTVTPKSPIAVDTTPATQVVDLRSSRHGDQLFAVDSNGGVFVLAVDALDGRLTLIDGADAGCPPARVGYSIDTSASALYVTCPSTNEVVQFEERFGELTEIGTPLAATGARQAAGAGDEVTAYVARNGSLDQHPIESDGTLGAATSSGAVAGQASDVALSPADPLAAPIPDFDTYGADAGEPVALDGDGTTGAESYLWEYEDGPSSGTFERDPNSFVSIAPVFTLPGTYQVRLTPRGRHLYDGHGTQQYGAQGTPETESVVVTPPDAPPSAPPTAPGVYVVGASSVVQYGEAADGRLVAKSPATVAGTDGALAGASAPDGSHLYVLNGNATISTFEIASDGRLTLDGAPVPAGTNSRYLAVSPDGGSLYSTSNGDTGVRQYTIAANGRPVAKSPAVVDVPGASSIAGLALRPAGDRLYVGANNGVARFAVAADGRLSFLGATTPATNIPEELRTSPDGARLYVVDFNGSIRKYDILAAGGLANHASFPFPRTCQPLAGTPSADGAFFYAACVNPSGFTRDIAQWSIDPGTGALSLLPVPYTVLGAFGIQGLTPNLGGSSVYAATGSGRQLSVTPGGMLALDSPSVLSGSSGATAIVTRPRQTVQAAFTATPATAGTPTQFDAGSSNPIGGASIARYDWDFGDGSTAPDAGPTTSHTYTAPGTYTPRLTVTSDSGSRTVYLGTTTLRRGSDRAEADVAVPAPPPAGAPPAPPTSPPVSSRTSPPIATAAQTSPPAPPPELGESVQARPVRGTVTVRLPNGRVVPLESLRTIPVGSIVDATRGRVRITVEAREGGVLESCDFSDGRFRVRQPDGRQPVTEAQLLAPATTPRARAAQRRRGSRAKSRRARTRKLWGDGKGRFRTKGRHSSATIRGTRWLVQETNAGTLTRVVRGSVTVRDLVRRRTVVVRAGGRYVARRR